MRSGRYMHGIKQASAEAGATRLQKVHGTLESTSIQNIVGVLTALQ